MSRDSSGMGMDILRDDDLNRVLANGHEYLKLENRELLFARPIEDLAFSDTFEPFYLTRGEGIWVPVGYSKAILPWAIKRTEEIEMAAKMFETKQPLVQGNKFGCLFPKENNESWYIDNIMFYLSAKDVKRAKDLVQKGLKDNAYSRELKQLDKFLSKATEEEGYVMACLDWLIYSIGTEGEEDNLKELRSYDELINKNPYLLFRKALYYETKKDDKECNLLYDKILEIDPRNIDATFNKALLNCRAKNEIEEMRWYQETIKIDPSFDIVHYDLGCTYSEKGDKEKAIDHYKLAIEANPFNVNAIENLAILYANNGDFALAKQLLIDGANIEPWREALYQNLIWVAQQSEDEELLKWTYFNLRTELPDSSLLKDS